MFNSPVGIDNLNLYVPPLSLSTANLAKHRNLSEKEILNAGFKCRSIMPPFEDVVTLGVNAAKPIVDG